MYRSVLLNRFPEVATAIDSIVVGNASTIISVDMETTARFRMSPEVVTRYIPDGAMLVNVQTGAAFKLNQIGAVVWRQLDGTRDVAAIVADIHIQYGVPEERALRDVDLLLEDLQKQRLIGPAGHL